MNFKDPAADDLLFSQVVKCLDVYYVRLHIIRFSPRVLVQAWLQVCIGGGWQAGQGEQAGSQVLDWGWLGFVHMVGWRIVAGAR